MMADEISLTTIDKKAEFRSSAFFDDYTVIDGSRSNLPGAYTWLLEQLHMMLSRQSSGHRDIHSRSLYLTTPTPSILEIVWVIIVL